ncbi:MAG: mucoidy inhibitor MuiA family protein, partial [Bacteroidia bacterium]|nr:mucoidy inhibitor MuiA family protein [Bacteroidia bacterium]
INEPLKLVYKANVQQNTGEDWDNVKLTFSNANPYQSGDLPILKPYYLNYVSGGYNRNPYKANASQNSYNLNNYISSNVTQASGRVVDQNSQPIAYATIKVQGTSVGTVTDESGNFSISLPQGKNQLFVSNIGYSDKWQAVSASSGNVIVLNSSQASVNAIALDEDGDGVGDFYDLQMETSSPEVMVRGITASKSYNRLSFTAPRKAKYEAKAITVMPMENQTTLELSLEIPFTIKSTGKQKIVSINEVDVPAYYEYRTVPKLEQAAFLIARVADWGEYNLLEGEANLYFENTYIGKSILDVRFLTDTLNISLGRDKNVLVSRQKVKSQTSRVLIGKDKIEKRQFEIKVRNNKSQPINLIVYDQVPLSQRPKDIIVDLKDKSGANHDLRTGELKWDVRINANETKELSMKYQVKFPQNQQINIE